MNLVICTIKSWNIKKAWKLKKELASEHNVYILDNKNELSYEKIVAYNPDYVFFPHWSYMIPENIYNQWNCIVFHMSDLPFGRGGSPLQNLIIRGINETKLSALQVTGSIDGGPVYLKENLNLYGTAEEIYLRASTLIFEKMIPQIIAENLQPKEQEGEVVYFKRRTPEQSELTGDMTLEQIYDHIRMLDGEGYPNAYITLGNYRLQLSRANLKGDKIIADVEIAEGDNE